MATTSNPEDFSAAQEEMQRQLDDLERQKDQLNNQYNSPRLLGKEFAGMYDDNHRKQLQGIQSKINEVHRQFRYATQQQQHVMQDRKAAQVQANYQQRLQDARDKAAEAQREKSLKATQSKLAGILGVKPDKVTDALDKAVYDPRTHKLIVPEKSKSETKAEGKERDRDYKALADKVKGYGVEDLATGRKIGVNPENILGKNPLPYKEDADGNRVYTLNGKPYAMIPSGDIDDLKKEYKDLTTKPMETGKPVSPETFDAVRQQIGILGGDVPKDVVGEMQAIEERGRLAQPALRAAFPDSYTGEGSPNPGMFGFGDVPSVTERIAPALSVPSSGGPNSFKPIALPSAPVTLQPPMLDQASANNAMYLDDSGNVRLAPNQPTLLGPSVAQRLPAQVITKPALGILPEATVNLPATTYTAPFQNNPLGNTEFAPPPIWQGTDTRQAPFRPGYVSGEQQARDAYRQLVPGATDEQIDASMKRAKIALGDNADPERVKNFAVGDLQADAASKAPGLGERMTTLGQFLPEPGIAQGGNPLRQTVYSDALRNLYEQYGAPVVSALTPDNNLSLLDQNRIRAIQNKTVPPTTTLDEYGKYVEQAQQEAADNFQNF